MSFRKFYHVLVEFFFILGNDEIHILLLFIIVHLNFLERAILSDMGNLEEIFNCYCVRLILQNSFT